MAETPMSDTLRAQLEQVLSGFRSDARTAGELARDVALATLDAVEAEIRAQLERAAKQSERSCLTGNAAKITGLWAALDVIDLNQLRLSLSVRSRTTEEKKNDQGSCGDTDVPPAADRNAHRRNESL